MAIRPSAVLFAGAFLALAGTYAFAADCELSGPGACHGDFAELTAVAADSREGFVAVGSLREPAGATGILRFDLSGGTRMFPVKPPDNPLPGDTRPLSNTDARDIIGVVGGDFVVVGVAQFGEGKDSAFTGWAALVGSDGATKWSVAYPGLPKTDELFHFGRLAPNGDVMVGGRIQTGPGDSKCSNWSKALIAWIDPQSGKLRRPPTLLGSETTRAAFYGGGYLPDGNLVFTGFLASNENSPSCLDRVVVAKTDANGNNAVLLSAPIGGVENEIATDLEVLDNQIIVSGTTFQQDFGAFAMVEDPKSTDQPLFRMFSRGNGGRDRFTAVERDPQTGSYWAVGFWSESKSAPFQAWWYLLNEFGSFGDRQRGDRRLPALRVQRGRHATRRADADGRLRRARREGAVRLQHAARRGGQVRHPDRQPAAAGRWFAEGDQPACEVRGRLHGRSDWQRTGGVRRWGSRGRGQPEAGFRAEEEGRPAHRRPSRARQH